MGAGSMASCDRLARWLVPACLSVHGRVRGPGELLPTGMSSSFCIGRKMLADVQGLGQTTFFFPDPLLCAELSPSNHLVKS